MYESEKMRKYYDKVIEIYKQTGYSPHRIAMTKIVPVHRTTISRWIANFEAWGGKTTPGGAMQRRDTKGPAESAEADELRRRIKDLEEQLLQTEVRAEFYEEMIKVAEAKYRIQIRKKAGAKQ